MENLKNIIDQCIKNDRASQNALFHHFANYVMNLTLRYIQEKQDAKAIFLESFEIIFRKIKQYDSSKGTFKSWISKITINQCLNFLKKRKLVLTDEHYVLDSAYNDELLEEMDAEYLVTLINQLGKPYSLVFNMVVDGYKHKEIGALLGVEEATSRSYYLRARKKLKENILKMNVNNGSWEEKII